jgi:hypothetical protein
VVVGCCDCFSLLRGCALGCGLAGAQWLGTDALTLQAAKPRTALLVGPPGFHLGDGPGAGAVCKSG